MWSVRRCNAQGSRKAEGPVIFTFVCDTRRWKQVFTEPTGGKITKTNPNGMIITRNFSGRVRSELKLEFPACKFQCKSWNVCERYARIYKGYWSCSSSGCATRVRIEGHRIGSGAIQFRANLTALNPSKSCSPVEEMQYKDLVNQLENQDQGLRDELKQTESTSMSPQIDGRSSQFYQEGTMYIQTPEVAPCPWSWYTDRNLQAYVKAPSWSMPRGSCFPGWEGNSKFPNSGSTGALAYEGTTTSDPLGSIEEPVWNMWGVYKNVKNDGSSAHINVEPSAPTCKIV